MNLLLTGDSQVRDTVPIARTDDFMAEMWRKFEWIVQRANELDAPVIHSGDLFDRGRPVHSQMLEITLIRILQGLTQPFLVVPGNHDLPYHTMEMLQRSSFGVLQVAGVIQNVDQEPWLFENKPSSFTDCVRVDGFGWEQSIGPPHRSADFNIAVLHEMVLDDADAANGHIPGLAGQKLLEDYPYYDLIVTGHNHQRFIKRVDDRTLVNPGSMMRETVDQIEYEPSIVVFDTETRETVVEKIPIEPGVISAVHRDERLQKDERILAFIESMKTGYEVGMSIRKNLERHFAVNTVSEAVEHIVWECLDGVA